ncbi:MAG: type IX secretion system membrane protein PorP/SprF [Crocinitomicaceae bacterium]|nr:type IX secretion system membrane protein PorP/SprF [Crocinitomicaceae bacterium]
MKNIGLLIAIVTFGLSGSLVAQQDIQFTQYFDNTLAVNPAYAGSNGMLNATAIHREQWVGIDGRPRSTTFSLHSPLNYESIGLGFTAVNDIVGPIQQTSFYADFSYTLNFRNSSGKLSFGLKAGLNLLNSRTEQLTTTNQNDPNLASNIQNQINPNFGGGIYYHTPKFFVGVSSPKILENGYGSSTSAKERRHYFFIAGGVMDLTKDQRWKLRPTTMFKFTNGAPLAIDLSAAAIYNQKLWLGLTHRWADSFGAFVQYQITNQFKAGIAYDQTITELAAYNKGTYEILLSYDFVFKKSGIRSPRYF